MKGDALMLTRTVTVTLTLSTRRLFKLLNTVINMELKTLSFYIFAIFSRIPNVCLVCLFMVLRPTREFFTHSETSPLPVKGSSFELCSALMAIEQ